MARRYFSNSNHDETEATLASIKSLKESLITNYNTPPTHSFIRRRLARITFRQKYRSAADFDDDDVDERIYEEIRFLKGEDQDVTLPHTDHVYIECLIRSNFDRQRALDILRHNRPDLDKPNEQPEVRESDETSVANAIQPLKQHYRSLNQHNQQNKLTRQLSRDDKWDNMQHLIPAIQQLRKKNNSSPDELVSKMHRLLYSEVSSLFGRQASSKIEMFASVLCETPIESIDDLDVMTLKNILHSTNPLYVSDDFRTRATSFLSIPCPICFNSYPRNRMENLILCDHMACRDCLKDYYRNNIDNIQDIHSINILTCFAEKHPVTDETHMIFFVWIERKIKQWFPDEPELRKKFEERVFHATSGKQIKKCGNTKCPSSVYIDDNGQPARVHCPHCNFTQCSQCCRKWQTAHAEITCEQYTRWLVDNDPDNPEVQLLHYLKSADSIVCPNKNCQMVFEYRAGGCEHFTCELCKTQFCRMCSVLFYDTNKSPKCPVPNCSPALGLHAHCYFNCFRETRLANEQTLTGLLTRNKINVTEELNKKPVSTNKKCPVSGCNKAVSKSTGDRLCESCYKHFLCSLIWKHQLRPWEIYENNNLEQMLKKASVTVPEKATRQQLIDLCNKHLNGFLGQPKEITRPKS